MERITTKDLDKIQAAWIKRGGVVKPFNRNRYNRKKVRQNGTLQRNAK